jgi:hypothetical protein
MEIRDAREGKEHRHADDGEEIVCPVCGAVWLQEVEGEYTFGTCEHLRFSPHSECDDDFEFFHDWDIEGFLELIEKGREKDKYAEVLDILSKIQLVLIKR